MIEVRAKGNSTGQGHFLKWRSTEESYTRRHPPHSLPTFTPRYSCLVLRAGAMSLFFSVLHARHTEGPAASSQCLDGAGSRVQSTDRRVAERSETRVITELMILYQVLNPASPSSLPHKS